MSCRGYIIHLKRATDRRRQAEAFAAMLPMPAELLEAVDGRAMTPVALQERAHRDLHTPRYPFPLANGEIACFLSHRRAWQAIVDSGCHAGLIAEDDVAASSPDFLPLVDRVLAGIEPGDFVRFPMRERGERGPRVWGTGPLHVIEPYLPALNMQMQIVGREAARLLLAASETFDRPVDSYVQMQWLHGARMLSARPIVIRELGGQLGGSVIHPRRRTLVDRLVHEVQRPLIRLAVRQANEQWRRKSA
jgi:GR25 family glycosyltransferase involved in LPS biosynthesis